MRATQGDPVNWSTCGSALGCGHELEFTGDSERLLGYDVEKARQLFKEAGYDGEKIIILDPTDLTGPLNDEDIAILNDLAALPEVAVMSETGIDHQDRSPDRQWQEDAFRAQINIARRHGLPIVFHVREQGDDYDAHSARDVALAVLRETNAGELGGTAHYFQGRWKHAARFLDLGFHISFAKTLTRISDLEETARKTPADRILVETDAYPQPFKKNRDRWTEPRDIPAIAEKLAIIRGTTADDIQRTTSENALNMLGTRSAKVRAVLKSSSSAQTHAGK
ncbi:MAG: TatD family hydrolase [Chloroflexi bacterium]|nr:TatD family hydrolase [Chloroflexota bacterium]